MVYFHVKAAPLISHILQRAAAPLAREEPAAAGVFGTLVRPVAPRRAGFGLDAGGGGRELRVPRDHHFSLDAGRLLLVAFVMGGAAVGSVSTAHRLEREVREEVPTFTSPILFSSSSFICTQMNICRKSRVLQQYSTRGDRNKLLRVILRAGVSS